jgi:L-lactate dehydrogenase complex protein LldG
VSAREEILARIRGALSDVPPHEGPEDVRVARDYRSSATDVQGAILERFEQRVRDYHATVRRVSFEEIGAAVSEACTELELRRIVVPPELPGGWRPAGIEVIEDDGLSSQALDAVDGAITGCAAAIAETGTLVLDGAGRSARRAITLVPDHHICIVEAEQVFGSVPEALARLGPAVRDRGVPVTLVSGPSASSDIELSRVEGVHGPRQLLVLLAG